jgi:Protein of unknown function (DUF998)
VSTPTRRSTGDRLTQILLACGVIHGTLYIILNDVVAAGLYEGYDPLSQAVSELSATGSPANAFLSTVFPVWPVLMGAFGIGVWRAADGRRALRITADLLVAHAIVGLLWLFFPMTARVDMAPGAPATVNDIGHLVMTVATIVLILSQIGFSAAVFGWRFRIYAIASVVTVVVFGALTAAQASKLPTGGTTPYMGFVERISIAPWLLWMAVLAVVLITAPSAPVSRRAVAPPGRADFPG